jgi:UDP-glucose 4-epimerase
MKTKILVTGGAGYIGSFMVRKLREEGYEVVIVDNLSCGHREAVADFRLEIIDLVTEKEKLAKLLAIEKFAAIIHMASFIQMGESFKNPAKYYRNNIIGFLNLLEAAVAADTKKIILSSSAGVYGNPVKVPIEEDDPKNPLNPYGETKYIMERMLEDFDAAYGVKFVAIRYFNAAGAALDGSLGEDHPEESHLIPKLIKAALAGKEVTIFGNDYQTSDGTCVRDYIHVLDLVDSHVLALKALLGGGKSAVYNAGVGRGYSNREVLQLIEEVSGLKIKVVYGPRRPGDADAFYASNEKIKRDLGWESKFGLKEIIKTAYLWHKKHPEGY